ncbi:response regulator transcription factor [Umezawaea sp. Da 62-37]|uniref:response regulator transcription factor n=1 Tax=Umezawaea sp. Da 62-37 TaxID=3075927 RepID=UPI0028F71EE2|nr:response regulator transcription factor [Umezawaea sp. Da 62-37]WNV88911.1 response regulator transcription factor [Umezawaea sp. Da 62-37]
MTVRVLVADDQALIRAGLVALFTAAPGLEVVGEAADGAEAVVLAAGASPDVILMDIRMPVLDGIAATREILAAAGEDPPKVVVLTTFDLDEYVYSALAGGASGFLLKDTPPDRIIAAVHTIAGGDVLLAPRITQRLIEAHAQRYRSAVVGELGGLTARETEVLRLVGNGLSNGQIAQRLVLSEATVKTHVKRVMGKLGLSSRAQAVVVAYETGLIVAAGGG